MNLWIDDLRKTSFNKTDLCEQLAQQMGITQREAKEWVDGFFDILVAELRRGNPVKLANFGTFSSRPKTVRAGRNSGTNERMEIETRRTIAFIAGPKLRSMLHPGPPTQPVAVSSSEGAVGSLGSGPNHGNGCGRKSVSGPSFPSELDLPMSSVGDQHCPRHVGVLPRQTAEIPPNSSAQKLFHPTHGVAIEFTDTPSAKPTLPP